MYLLILFKRTCLYTQKCLLIVGFPRGSDGKESACNVGDLSSTPGLGRSSGEGNDNPLQDFCLENSLDRGAWYTTVHGVTKNRTRLSDYHSHSAKLRMQCIFRRERERERKEGRRILEEDRTNCYIYLGLQINLPTQKSK